MPRTKHPHKAMPAFSFSRIGLPSIRPQAPGASRFLSHQLHPATHCARSDTARRVPQTAANCKIRHPRWPGPTLYRARDREAICYHSI